MAQGTRRRAREAALKILFQMDLAGTNAKEATAAYWECFDLEAEGDEYAGKLVKGIDDQLDSVDREIKEASTKWRLERMARVDRNVIRIGAYELLYRHDVPTRVVLDEAIELGKRFGSEDSGAFVNGVLDKVAQTARSDDEEDRTDSGQPPEDEPSPGQPPEDEPSPGQPPEDEPSPGQPPEDEPSPGQPPEDEP